MLGGFVQLIWSPPHTGEFALPQVLYYELLVGSSPGSADLGVYRVSADLGYFEGRNVPRGIYYVRVRAMTTEGLTEVSNELVLHR